jgi:hypothetical protein
MHAKIRPATAAGWVLVIHGLAAAQKFAGMSPVFLSRPAHCSLAPDGFQSV